MISSLDLLDLVPILILIWVLVPLFELVQTFRSVETLSARRVLYAALQGISNSGWLTVFLVAKEAHSQNADIARCTYSHPAAHVSG
jgi:hypothetical protein